MKLGDIVLYWFSQKYPYTGMVVKKWRHDKANFYTYLYTVQIIENNGNISIFDIYEGDIFEVIVENGRSYYD